MLRGALIALGIAAAVIVVAVLSGGGEKQTGRAAPALPAEVLVGPRVDVAALRGKPAIVNFWASWCGPCKKEAAGFERLAGRLGDRARLVGVNWNNSLSGARGFVRHYHWTFPNLRDGDGTVGDDYQIRGLPTTFILDARGRVVKTLVGPQTADEVESALGKAS